MPTSPSSRFFDFSMKSGTMDGERLRHDIDNLCDLKSLAEVDALEKRVHVAIDNIKAAMKVAENVVADNSVHRNMPDYDDWRKRAEFSRGRYELAIDRIESHRRKLDEKRRIQIARRERLRENLIAAKRKRDEASINAIFQLNKNLGFIEALKKRGIIPREEWKDLWDEAEQIAFDRRQEYEGVTYRKLDSYIARLRKELDAEGIENDATG